MASLFLFVHMKLPHCVWLIAFCLLLAACQPELVLVEVTREVVGEGAVTVVAPTTVEVTRLVATEVTRVVAETVTEEILIEVTKPPLGTVERPIQLLFPPQVNTAVISSRSEALVVALARTTGQQFAVGVLDSEQAVIDLMCAAPVDTIGFLTGAGYVLAHEQCDVQVAAVAKDDMDLTGQMGMIVVREDSEIETLAELAGRRGAVPDSTSLPNSFYVQAMLETAGVNVVDISEIPSDSSTMLAVLAGDVDFAVATFLPPLLPFAERDWAYDVDDPEVWRQAEVAPRRSPLGYVLVNGEPQAGGYRIRDARARVFDIAPMIFAETRILTVTAPIANDTIAFGPDFPLGTARQVQTAVLNFVNSEACASSLCSSDFYNWTGLVTVEDDFYEPLRFVLSELALTHCELTPAVC